MVKTDALRSYRTEKSRTIYFSAIIRFLFYLLRFVISVYENKLIFDLKYILF